MNRGRIEVITGPMFSGKTSEVLRRLMRYSLAGKSYVYLKPKCDTRNQKTSISTVRGELNITPIYSDSFLDISEICNSDVIVVDEAQFVKHGLKGFCRSHRNDGQIVLICGLDMDSHMEPFSQMGDIMAIADSVTKLTAICKCGAEAPFTKKISGNPGQRIEIGDKELYAPRCLNCYLEEE